MATYSYEDFERAANKAGLWNQFSQADLNTAKSNPDFGMSILGLKQEYGNAATDEQRQQINDQANALRSSYGNYTGGADGSKYISTGLLNQKIDDQLDKVRDYAPFSYDTPAPTYNNQYADQQAALLNEILSRKEFEWSKEADPNWSAYKKEYLREGDRATANALAWASAASGGRPSSYAVTAADQAGDYYAGQLADKIPELYQQAYERYLAEQQMKYSDLNAVNAQEQLDYAKFQDQLAQYNTDRNFAYTDYQNQYNMLQNYLANLQGQQQTEFNQNLTVQEYQDEIARYQQEQKQAQINAILSAGGMPSAELMNGSGYVDEYAQAIAADYQRQQADSEKSTLAQYGSAFLQQGVMPSDAMLAAMGITAADAQGYIAAVKAGLVSGSSGGSSKGSGGGNDAPSGETGYDALFKAALASGYPQSYIANNYKNYGFTSNSGLYNDYQTWYEGQSDGLQVDVTSVLALGYGPISETRLNELVQSGQVQEYEENGYLKFRKVQSPVSEIPSLFGLR